MNNIIRGLLTLLFMLLLSSCGTVQRFTEYQLVQGTNEQGEPLNYYHPYKPYFRSIRVDNDYLSLCWTIIACPIVLIDYPISLVTDVLMLPADFTRDRYIHAYNEKHTTTQEYGVFTLKYQALYGFNRPYLSIYYKDQQQPIQLPTGYNLKIIEKKLTPTAKLLVETVKGHLYLIEDKDNTAVVSRVGNNSKFWVSLPTFPDIHFFYRPLEEDNCSRVYCGFTFRRWSLPQACESSVDPRNFSFTLGIDNQLNIISWDKQSISQPMAGLSHVEQSYVISISPDKAQAVYLEEGKGIWVADKSSTKMIALTEPQKAELTRLKERYAKNRIEEMNDSINTINNSYFIENTITLYKAYIKWAERHSQWSLINGMWQFKII